MNRYILGGNGCVQKKKGSGSTDGKVKKKTKGNTTEKKGESLERGAP